MKELLLKIRHWLIKKLGGYTEQYAPQQIRVSPPVTIHPERIFAQMRVSYDEAGGIRERELLLAERVKNDLTFRLVSELIEKKFVLQTCEQDILRGWPENVYTVSLCVLPPNEWMKTQLGDFFANRPGWKGERHELF